MSHLSNLLGPVDPLPENIRVGAWSLCEVCSHDRHRGHMLPCCCDLCDEESP